MKVRRIRYVTPYQVEDDNPYRDMTKPLRKFFRDWREIETVRAEVVQLDHVSRFPGRRFMLRIPMRDPETQRMTDADGDRAVLRISMVGAEMDYIGSHPSFKGFVSKQELLYEEEYRAGNLQGCIDTHRRYELDTEYVIEEWQVQR